MNITMLYNMFVRDFRKQQKRITLTLIALAWGTLSIMLLLAFGEGLRHQLTVNSRGMGQYIAVLWGGQTSIPFKGLGKGRRVKLTADDVEYLQNRIPEIKNIAGEYSRWSVETRFADKVLTEHVTGVYPNYEEMRNHIPERGGRMINDRDMEQKRRVAFLGHALKKRLFADSEAVGKDIMVNGVPFTVVGVMINKIQMNSYEGQDIDNLVIPFTTFQSIFGDPWIDNMIYQPHKLEDMKLVEQRIRELLGAKYKFDSKDDRAVSIWDVASNDKEMTNILLGIKIFLGIIGGLTLIIAGVGVANIMYVSVKERTREIGIKMAVGAKKSLILSQFLLEAIIITFFGGSIGMSVAYILTEAFKRVPIKSDVLDFMGRPTVDLSIGLAVVTILGIMGLLSGFFPALRASSVRPVEALRYE